MRSTSLSSRVTNPTPDADGTVPGSILSTSHGWVTMVEPSTLEALLEELPVSRAARLAARLLELPKGRVYERALELAARRDT